MEVATAGVWALIWAVSCWRALMPPAVAAALGLGVTGASAVEVDAGWLVTT